jgi:hypothetical protein
MEVGGRDYPIVVSTRAEEPRKEEGEGEKAKLRKKREKRDKTYRWWMVGRLRMRSGVGADDGLR